MHRDLDGVEGGHLFAIQPTLGLDQQDAKSHQFEFASLMTPVRLHSFYLLHSLIMKKTLALLVVCGVASVTALPAEAAPKRFRFKAYKTPKIKTYNPPKFKINKSRTLNFKSNQSRFDSPKSLNRPGQFQPHPDWQWQTEVEPRRHPQLMPSIPVDLTERNSCQFVWTDEMSGEFVC